jgi:hypothetical protein
MTLKAKEDTDDKKNRMNIRPVWCAHTSDEKNPLLPQSLWIHVRQTSVAVIFLKMWSLQFVNYLLGISREEFFRPLPLSPLLPPPLTLKHATVVHFFGHESFAFPPWHILLGLVLVHSKERALPVFKKSEALK